MGRKKTVVFLHPDLGIGGAERLVVDAAVSLQERGQKVVIFTSHCDPAHCFDEARNGTLDIRVRGNTIFPPSILGRFAIFCAIARQIHLILSISMTGEVRKLQPTDFFVDQLSAGLPLLRFVTDGFAVPASDEDKKRKDSGKRPSITTTMGPTRPSIFFYCHFPDLLLARGREGLLKRLYRIPFDALEEWSMGFADGIAVNSSFTKGIVSGTWPRLVASKKLEVVYPCVDTSVTGEDGNGDGKGATTTEIEKQKGAKAEKEEEKVELWKNKTVFLSINRFERKKDIGLAIRAFGRLLHHHQEERKQQEQQQNNLMGGGAKPRLVIAGGYDPRVAENVEYHHELERLADSFKLSHATCRTLPTALAVPDNIQVVFMPSVPNKVKDALLASAALLLYTPQNEHFGIVPLEAMLWGVPVLAADSGGPRETVSPEVGWLRKPEEEAWCRVLEEALMKRASAEGREELKEMGRMGRQRVKGMFGRERMGERFDDVFDELGFRARRSGMVRTTVGLMGILGVVILAVVVAFTVGISNGITDAGCGIESQGSVAQVMMDDGAGGKCGI